MEQNTKTHKVITTKTTSEATGLVRTKRTYRGVDITKRKDGTFVYIATAYYAGIKCNNWFYGGLHTLKDAVATIDKRIDERGYIVDHGKLYSPEAWAFINREGK